MRKMKNREGDRQDLQRTFYVGSLPAPACQGCLTSSPLAPLQRQARAAPFVEARLEKMMCVPHAVWSLASVAPITAPPQKNNL